MRERIDPTTKGDIIASEMRDYYEANRESWWERRRKRWTMVADNLMLGLLMTAMRADEDVDPPPTEEELHTVINGSKAVYDDGKVGYGLHLSGADCRGIVKALDDAGMKVVWK